MPQVERSFVPVPSGRIHVAAAGSGAPVLLLHQTPRSWDEFRDVLPLLGRHYRAIAMDTIGYGDSDPLREGQASIESWAKGYGTSVGERGIRLSGGQRQRIGIARALYKRADFIVFDEATSALDSETEGAVMEAIDTLSEDLTILIVAHRLSTLRSCDQIIQLDGGVVSWMGPYQKIVEHAS